MTRANTDNLLGGFPKVSEAVFRSCNAEHTIAQESPG
jgi:hypothetical protein